MDGITQGLEVSVLGLVITFLALGAFILIIMLLKRLFPEREAGQETPEAADAPEDADEGEVVAAIAAAIAETDRGGELGRALELGHSPWWKAGKTDLPVRSKH